MRALSRFTNRRFSVAGWLGTELMVLGLVWVSIADILPCVTEA